MSRHSFNTWAGADACLQGGRHKDYRRVGSTRYVARQSDGSISLVLHYTAIVTYHQDGTFTLFHDGWKTVTTQRYINEFSPFRIHSSYDRNYPGWKLGETGERTPSRRWKCRSCKGAGGSVQRKECYGPSTWEPGARCDGAQTMYAVAWNYKHGEEDNWEEYRASRYTVPCKHGPAFEHSHITTLCEHGQRRRHQYGDIFESKCHRCDGEGIAEYGDNSIPLIWPGNKAVRMAADGTVLDLDAPRYCAPGKPSKPYKAKPYKPPTPFIDDGVEYTPKHKLGSNTTKVLEAAIPAMRTEVACPSCKGGDEGKHRDSITSMVIHLNDGCSWTREQIADWLDTLDADLRFPTPEDVAA